MFLLDCGTVMTVCVFFVVVVFLINGNTIFQTLLAKRM
jgi:hypothetical protein